MARPRNITFWWSEASLCGETLTTYESCMIMLLKKHYVVWRDIAKVPSDTTNLRRDIINCGGRTIKTAKWHNIFGEKYTKCVERHALGIVGYIDITDISMICTHQWYILLIVLFVILPLTFKLFILFDCLCCIQLRSITSTWFGHISFSAIKIILSLFGHIHRYLVPLILSYNIFQNIP